MKGPLLVLVIILVFCVLFTLAFKIDHLREVNTSLAKTNNYLKDELEKRTPDLRVDAGGNGKTILGPKEGWVMSKVIETPLKPDCGKCPNDVMAIRNSVIYSCKDKLTISWAKDWCREHGWLD